MSETSKGGTRGWTARRVALVVHRYVGLVVALFLVIAGLTGSVLAFYHPLDRALNPELLTAQPPHPGAALLDPFVLRERVQAQLPKGQDHFTVSFDVKPDQAVGMWMQLDNGEWREGFVDPYTGRILGMRDWGNLAEGKQNLLPFLYSLHYALALDDVGMVLFGIVALLWTLDCFVGMYLTLPATAVRTPRRKTWIARWLPMWLLRANQLFSFVFTWHRASGLWLWGLLLVFAWSAVGLNLPAVYETTMGALTGMQPSVHSGLPELQPPFADPKLTLTEAHARGRQLMDEQAQRHHFTIEREHWLTYAQDHGVFIYAVESSLDLSSEHPGTEVYFDGHDGHLVGFEAPTGLHAGNTLSSWLFALHMGMVGGMAYRGFLVLFGLCVAALSVTGVWIWWRKRSKQQVRAATATSDDDVEANASGLTPAWSTAQTPSESDG